MIAALAFTFGYLLGSIPFGLIVYLLAEGYSPTGAAFYTIAVTFALSFLDRQTWMTPRRCWEALTEAYLFGLLHPREDREGREG